MTRAFSLLELVVVLMIISVAALIAVPKYAASASRFRVEAAASRISDDIELMRTRARAASEPRVIEFNVSTDVYQIAGEQGLDRSSNYVVDLTDAPYNADITLVDFDSNDSLTIDGFGAVSITGRIVVRAGSEYRTIFVGAASATVENGVRTITLDPLDIGGGNLVSFK